MDKRGDSVVKDDNRHVLSQTLCTLFIYYSIYTFEDTQCRSSVANSPGLFLGSGRKSENMEKTHTNMGGENMQNTQIRHTGAVSGQCDPLCFHDK